MLLSRFLCIAFTGFLIISSCKKKNDDVPAFKIERAEELGALNKPPALIGRDGGQTVMLSGKILWLFGDSFFDRKSADSTQSRSNTAAQSTVDNLLNTTEPVDANGVSYQFIPFTSGEKHFNDSLNNPDNRIALWPTGAVSKDNVTAFVFYSKVYLQNSWQDVGIGIAKYKLDQSAAIRNEGLLFNYPEPNFQTPFLYQGYLYLFGQLRNKSGGGIARVPAENMEERDSYECWDGSSWTKDINAAEPVISESGGSFSYNSYFKQFIHIYNEFANNTVYIQFAAAPQGPWSAKQSLYETIKPDHDYNYIMTEHPELSQNNGKTIYISYHHPLPAFLAGEIRLVKINFK